MKRSREEAELDKGIDNDFLQQCEKKFREDPSNIIARNAITSVGATFATTNSNKGNQVSHVFLNSVKKKDLKATDQGHSGRCWIFAGLNTFRHLLINAFNLENFEFSETYLFFWDKLERANTYINWFIDNPQYKAGDREFDYIASNCLSDGGWWSMFANLVNKYGMVPKSAMKETFQSEDSDEMNTILEERLNSCVNYIRKLRKRKKVSKEELHKIRKETLLQVYNILVKFLGEPPKKFEWAFCSDEEPNVVRSLTPQLFTTMIIPGLDMHDFVSLGHIPTKEMKLNERYQLEWSANVYEGEEYTMLNVHPDDMARCAIESILAGLAVWFSADVGKHFNYIHSTLDDELADHDLVFGKPKKITKGERMSLHDIQANHAMALTGVNIDEKGRPLNWQVENSWGYWDNETPGLDGFLNMSNSWFKKYVTEVVVHKKFLSRRLQGLLKKKPIRMKPWSGLEKVSKVKGMKVPQGYRKIFEKKS